MKLLQEPYQDKDMEFLGPMQDENPTGCSRLKQAIKPIIPGLILDATDFLTFGPLGIYLGLIVGCPVGYWMCSKYRMSFAKRLIGACVAGLYCTLPFTGFLPAAVLVSFYARFWERPQQKNV